MESLMPFNIAIKNWQWTGMMFNYYIKMKKKIK